MVNTGLWEGSVMVARIEWINPRQGRNRAVGANGAALSLARAGALRAARSTDEFASAQHRTARAWQLRNCRRWMCSCVRAIDALSERITLHMAQRSGLKELPDASDLIARKLLIPKEVLLLVSASRRASDACADDARGHRRAAGQQARGTGYRLENALIQLSVDASTRERITN